MRVISTVHKAGFDVYGERWLEGISRWPKGTEFILYTEGFDLEHDGVTCRRIESVDRAEKFKSQYAHYQSVSWRWDVKRFCNKSFAVYDGLRDYRGIGLWLDADCITYSDIPDGYVEGMLPDGYYLARFERESSLGLATETGFWIADCNHPEHVRFMDTWIKWYESGSFKGLSQWCDAATMDATVKIFRKHNVIKTVNLSGKFLREEHPMSKVDLARYIDHLKGQRKDKDVSPENLFHAEKRRKLVNGWWFPLHEEHIPEVMEQNGKHLNGRLAYQAEKQAASMVLCKQRRVALDIGAHVGLWSFNVSKEFSTVYAFEPVADHIDCFRQNVIASNVHLINAAVGAEAGKVSMKTTPGNSGDSYVDGDGDIDMITIDGLGLDNIDFIKIDCQGYEEEVVKGALETIKKCRPVIVVEQKPTDRGDQFGALKLLKSIGYKVEKEVLGDYIMTHGGQDG